LIDPKFQRTWRVVVKSLVGFSIGAWLFHAYLWDKYDRINPQHPDTSNGRVFVQDTHGHVVYLTKGEDTGLAILTIGAFSLFTLAGVIHVFILGEHRRKPWDKKQW
jgi:hypothetical protein